MAAPDGVATLNSTPAAPPTQASPLGFQVRSCVWSAWPDSWTHSWPQIVVLRCCYHHRVTTQAKPRALTVLQANPGIKLNMDISGVPVVTTTTKRSVKVSTRLGVQVGGPDPVLNGEQLQAKLVALLPEAIKTLKQVAVAAATAEVADSPFIGGVISWDRFLLGVEAVINWGSGAIEAIAIGLTYEF
jgi:hypothetical protein